MDRFLDEIWRSDRLFLDKKFVFVADEERLGIILACDCENYDRFISLPEFREILTSLNFHANIYSVQNIQIGAINALKQSKISSQKILFVIDILRKENIISKNKFNKIYDFLSIFISENLEFKDIIKENFFHSKKEVLMQIFDKFYQLCNQTRFESRLRAARQKIENLHFNIVITGVVNAGKSSLLNALLNKKILGSSNVPETTNLNILKFSNSSFANVAFWNRAEIDALEIKFKTEFEPFLGSIKKIDVANLKDYTSTTSPISPLVKSVEIFENLDLLRDGICIIDTPGIDDVVFLRERLVREFMSECDLMVHLMNVSQTCTQKDVEFITNSLANSRISRLVILITHIDLVEQNELGEVLLYTQKSLKDRFDKFGVEIAVFAVSSKAYFKGNERNGVDEFKRFLYETFFSQNNEKSKLGILGFEREMMSVCDEFLAETDDKILIFNSSNTKIIDKFKDLKEKEMINQKEREMITNSLEKELEKIDLSRLEADFRANLKILSKTLSERVNNDISYHKKIDKKRISYIVSSGLNDGIMHLLRQNRNEILSQLRTVEQNMVLKFSGFQPVIDERIFNVYEYLTHRGVKFDFNGVCDKICARKDASLAIDEFLSNELIKGLVLELVKHEKDCFTSKILDELNQKNEKFELIKSALKEQMDLLNNSNLSVINELKRLEEVKNSLQYIKERLKNA